VSDPEVDPLLEILGQAALDRRLDLLIVIPRAEVREDD
jgi:hypothetical protein